VLGVRDGRRDLGVAARRDERAIRERRIVVAVDQIMGDARMVGLFAIDFFEDGRRLQLVGVRLVGRIGGGVQRERVEYRRLVVPRIARVDALHGLFVGDGARAVVKLVGVLVERLDGGDVVPLTLGLGARCLGFLDRRPPFLERRRARRLPERLVHAHADAPVAHGAVGIGLGDGGERLHRLLVPERVQQSDGTFELRLRRAAALSWRRSHKRCGHL